MAKRIARLFVALSTGKNPNQKTKRATFRRNRERRTLMSADLDARRRASFSLRFCFADFPPSSKSSIAVGTILGGRYAPPASPASSSSALPTSASGLGRKRNGSSSSSSSPSPRLLSFRGPSAILSSLSIWYLSLRSIGRSFSRYARISTSRSTTGWSRTERPSDLSSR